jgi:hypothetical protein
MSDDIDENKAKLFKKPIIAFTQNMEALRDFVTIVAASLKEREQKIFKEHASHLAPLFLAFRKLDPKAFPEGKFSDEEIAKRFEGKISVNVKDEGDGKKSAQIQISGSGERDFDTAMKELQKNHLSTSLLYSSTLISMMSAVELFLSRLIHLYFQNFPDAIGGKDKIFSLEDLKGFDSIQDASAHIVETRVESVLRGSFEDWVIFFKTHPKLSMGYPIFEEIRSDLRLTKFLKDKKQIAKTKLSNETHP